MHMFRVRDFRKHHHALSLVLFEILIIGEMKRREHTWRTNLEGVSIPVGSPLAAMCDLLKLCRLKGKSSETLNV